jgi:prephenate dehydrogenase
MKVAIVGGSGKMGQWFARFLLKEGKQVIITGRNEKKLLAAGEQLGVDATTSNVEAVRQADIVLLSVPVDNFEQVVQQISPHTNSGQVILDVTSVKALPVEAMHRHIKAGLVLGTHPVFGPGARDITNQNFVLTPTNEEETALAQKIRQYLEDRDARATLMTPDEHDEMMAVVLGLSHFIAIASADALLSFDRFQRMKEIGGTTYRVLLTLVESVISEDPELYASLQMGLPGMNEVEELFLKKSKEWADLVRSKDRQEFARRMTTLRTALEKADPDFGRAYENMYKLLGS